MAMKKRTLHLIYIHGFQGDHTTFQAFPSDLHSKLMTALSLSCPHISLKSSVYPTYKTRRPLSEATGNFLKWLSTTANTVDALGVTDETSVFLMGHSMGGLLAAEAAIALSDNKNRFNVDTSASPKIVGVVAFDTPFLGMHPHVVISGLASLFPQDDEKVETRPEREMNKHAIGKGHVHMITEADVSRSNEEVPSRDIKTTPTTRNESDEWDAFKSTSSLSLPISPNYRSPSSSTSPTNSPNSPPPHNHLPSPSIVDKTLAFVASHSDDRFVKFVMKHKENPVGAMTAWVTEHFVFGSLMFEPHALLERYSALEKWKGVWINYWTTTTEHDTIDLDRAGNEALKINGSVEVSREEETSDAKSITSVSLSESMSEGNSIASSERDTWTSMEKTPPDAHSSRTFFHRHKPKTIKPHHFIILPSSHSPVASKWEKVPIRGVEDEVAAHCGIFIRTQNLEYDLFVGNVSEQIIKWVKVLGL